MLTSSKTTVNPGKAATNHLWVTDGLWMPAKAELLIWHSGDPEPARPPALKTEKVQPTVATQSEAQSYTVETDPVLSSCRVTTGNS